MSSLLQHTLLDLAPSGNIRQLLDADFVGQASESAKHILLEYEPLDTSRRRISEGKPPGVEEDAGPEYEILELVKGTLPKLGTTINLFG